MAPTKRPVLHHVEEAGFSISGFRQFLQELAEPALGSDGRVLDPGDVWVEGQLLSTKVLSIGWTEHIGDVAQFVKQVENRTGIEIQRVIGTPSERISPTDPILLLLLSHAKHFTGAFRTHFSYRPHLAW